MVDSRNIATKKGSESFEIATLCRRFPTLSYYGKYP